MMRCAQRRFQPSPNTPRPSLENHRGGLDGLGVFLHCDSNIEAKIPQKDLRNWNANKQNAMRYLSLFVSVFRLLIFKFCDKTYATKPFLTITSAQVRFGCICSLCCKLQLFNFATKPFHVTRSAKRPRHNHPIGTAIYSMKKKHVFTCHRVFQIVEIYFAATPIHFKLKLFNVFV